MASDAKIDFSLADGHGYMLSRNHAAACRLNLQHYLWKEALGFTIHPSISIPPNAKIADVAVGTCMWLMDVARTYPSSQLDGFDMDLSQAPHASWLPSNVSTYKWNIFDELPEQFVGKYDYVHLRLLVLVVNPETAPGVIRNLYRMLKPGGYLQWDEVDCVDMSVKKVDSSLAAPSLEKLKEMTWANGRHDWTVKLDRFVEKEGFADSTLEYYGDGKELIRAFNEQHLMTTEEFALELGKTGKKEAAETFFGLIANGYQEALTGCALCVPRVVVVARKPS